MPGPSFTTRVSSGVMPNFQQNVEQQNSITSTEEGQEIEKLFSLNVAKNIWNTVNKQIEDSYEFLKDLPLPEASFKLKFSFNSNEGYAQEMGESLNQDSIKNWLQNNNRTISEGFTKIGRNVGNILYSNLLELQNQYASRNNEYPLKFSVKWCKNEINSSPEGLPQENGYVFGRIFSFILQNNNLERKKNRIVQEITVLRNALFEQNKKILINNIAKNEKVDFSKQLLKENRRENHLLGEELNNIIEITMGQKQKIITGPRLCVSFWLTPKSNS